MACEFRTEFTTDIYEPDESPDWGPEEEMLTSGRRFEKKEFREPYSATEMGLIYVNPAGPGGVSDPKRSAEEIRYIFARMGINDEETVALIGGGHAYLTPSFSVQKIRAIQQRFVRQLLPNL
nr:peroxidase family protein [Archaeoglobus neptunius]